MVLTNSYWPADTSMPVLETTVGGVVREAAARALASRFGPGERVAVWAPNLPEWILLEFGAALAGLTLVTVNPAYRPQELRHVLDQSEAAGIFLVPEFRSPMA